MPGQSLNNSPTTVDGAAHYRVDPTGWRVLVVPATCRHGHDLATGYRVRESAGLIHVRCTTCAATGVLDPHWTLRGAPPIANQAELDDTPYPDLQPRRYDLGPVDGVTPAGLPT